MKRRILLLLDGIDIINGVTVTYRELHEYWGRLVSDHELFVVGSSAFGSQHLDTRSSHLVVYSSAARIPLYGYKGVSYSIPFNQVRRLLDEITFDCIHIAIPGPLGLLGLRLARQRNIPLITSHHTRLLNYVDIYYSGATRTVLRHVVSRITRALYSSSLMTVVHSPQAGSEAASMGSSKVHFVPMGVRFPYSDFDVLIQSRHRARTHLTKHYGLPTNTPVVIYVGRLGKEKNPHTLARACAMLGLPLFVAGNGPLADEIKTYPKAILLGELHGQDLSNLYLAADLLASTSVSETLGRVFLVSLAHGTPILVPSQGFHNSQLPSNLLSAIRFPTNASDRDEDNVAHSLCSLIPLITNPTTFKPLAKSAWNFAIHSAWERVLPCHVQVYEEILN